MHCGIVIPTPSWEWEPAAWGKMLIAGRLEARIFPEDDGSWAWRIFESGILYHRGHGRDEEDARALCEVRLARIVSGAMARKRVRRPPRRLGTRVRPRKTLTDRIVLLLRAEGRTTDALSEILGIGHRSVIKAIHKARRAGHHIDFRDERYCLEREETAS